MQRDARLLLEFRLSVIAGFALLVFVVLDAMLALTGLWPWDQPPIARLTICLSLAAVALLNAWRVWSQRVDRALAAVTFGEVVLVGGLAVVGGVVLLGAFR